MSLLPPEMACDRCNKTTKVQTAGTVPERWVSMVLVYHAKPNGQADLCSDCIREVREAGGLNLEQKPSAGYQKLVAGLPGGYPSG